MKIQERIDNLNKAIKLANEEKGIKRVKIQELNLTKEDKIGLLNGLTDLYVVIKGNFYKIIEIEEYKVEPYTHNTIKRDSKGRFVKRN